MKEEIEERPRCPYVVCAPFDIAQHWHDFALGFSCARATGPWHEDGEHASHTYHDFIILGGFTWLHFQIRIRLKFTDGYSEETEA